MCLNYAQINGLKRLVNLQDLRENTPRIET